MVEQVRCRGRKQDVRYFSCPLPVVPHAASTCAEHAGLEYTCAGAIMTRRASCSACRRELGGKAAPAFRGERDCQEISVAIAYAPEDKQVGVMVAAGG